MPRSARVARLETCAVIAFIGRRLVVALAVVLLATIVVFALVSARGDPLRELRHRPGVSQQTIRNLEHEYHLDESKPAQYVLWLGDFVQGDWGESFRTDRPVSDMVGEATWNSFLLVGTALVFSVVLAMLIGVVSAVRQYSAFDHVATGFSYFGFSMPDFFFALLLQLVLVVVLQEQFGIQLFYVQGKYTVGQEGNLGNLVQHMVLPVLTLMLTSVAAWSRYQRDSMLEVLQTDYVRTARAKGVPSAPDHPPPRAAQRAHPVRDRGGDRRRRAARWRRGRRAGVQLAGARPAVLRRARAVRLPGAPGVDGGGDGVRRAVQPARRRALRRCSTRGSGCRAEGRGGYGREHARRRRVGRRAEHDAGSPRRPDRDPAGRWPVATAAWRRFRRHRVAMVGLGFLVFMFLACFVGAHFAQDPNYQDLLQPTSGPSAAHWFGTDELSRDSLSRVLHGGQISLEGRARRRSALDGHRCGDRRARRLLPGLARRPAHALHRPVDRAARRCRSSRWRCRSARSISGRSARSTSAARSGSRCCCRSCSGARSRVVRGATLALREREFVDAARAIGASNTRIIVRHVLPNCLGPIIVNATLVVAEAILVESTLSFLGFGIQPPTPSWGNLLSDSIGTLED